MQLEKIAPDFHYYTEHIWVWLIADGPREHM